MALEWLRRDDELKDHQVFGDEHFGKEAPTAWLEDTTESQRLFGKPRVPIETMIDWVADWVARGQPSLGKPTHFSTRDGKY